MGGTKQEMDLHNVLFVGRKVDTFQEMIAVKPDAFPHAAIR